MNDLITTYTTLDKGLATSEASCKAVASVTAEQNAAHALVRQLHTSVVDATSDGVVDRTPGYGQRNEGNIVVEADSPAITSSPDKAMLSALGCTAEQVARKPEDINERTKAYVGPLMAAFFRNPMMSRLEQVYTSFPEGRIRLESLEIGSMTVEELEQALENAGIKNSVYSMGMFHNRKQFIDPVNKRHKGLKGETETLDLVRLRVRDLGYSDPSRLPMTREIFGNPGQRNGRIHELGLECCPPETGPYKRLVDTDQPLGDWYSIGMEPVADSGGDPRVFGLGRGEGGLWLGGHWAGPGGQWSLGGEVVLRRSKFDA